VVERRSRVGGAATAVSGVPVKTLRDAAIYLSGWMRRDTYGVGISLAPDVVMNRLRARVRQVVAEISSAVEDNLKRHDIELVHGEAGLGPDRTVIVRDEQNGERTLRARAILLAAGSHPYRPASIPFADPDVHALRDSAPGRSAA
jgi:NAD(P) transhydrogenase